MKVFVVTKSELQKIARGEKGYSTFFSLGRDLTENEIKKVVADLRKSLPCPVRYYSKR